MLLAAAYPKWDAYSMQFLSAPATGLTVLSIHRYPVLLSRLVLQIAVLLIFGYSVLYSLGVRDRLSLVPTRAGYLLADEQSGLVLEKLEQTVNRGSTLFVYPCVASLYPLLDVINPAPYVYRQPGMRNARDEART